MILHGLFLKGKSEKRNFRLTKITVASRVCSSPVMLGVQVRLLSLAFGYSPLQIYIQIIKEITKSIKSWPSGNRLSSLVKPPNESKHSPRTSNKKSSPLASNYGGPFLPFEIFLYTLSQCIRT